MSGHTPGPWVTRAHDGWFLDKDADSGETGSWGVGPADSADPVAIVIVDGRYTDATFVANAHLLAAAPDLLVAAQDAIAKRQPTEHGFFYLPDDVWLALSAAIAKALAPTPMGGGKEGRRG